MTFNSSLFLFLYNLLNVFPGVDRTNTVRGWLVRMTLKACGRKLKISSRVNIFNPENITIGDNVYIGCCCYFGGGEIVLEDEVTIGPFVTIAAGNHTMEDGSYRFGPYEFGAVRVGRGTWLCANSVITSGVTIGKGCVVAAGSVVIKDVPDYSVVFGVPAKIVKTVTPEVIETLRAHSARSV